MSERRLCALCVCMGASSDRNMSSRGELQSSYKEKGTSLFTTVLEFQTDRTSMYLSRAVPRVYVRMILRYVTNRCWRGIPCIR